MYAQLGIIIFEGLRSPSEMEHQVAASYAEHALIHGKPRLQRTGTELERVKLTIQLHSSFCNVQGEIDALKDVVNSGEVLPLVTGYGKYVGDFIARAVTNEALHSAPNGALISASVDVDLLEFVNTDKLGSAAQAAVNSGFAMSLNTPGIVQSSAPISSIAGDITANVEAVNLQGSAVTGDLSAASAPADRDRLLKSVGNRMLEINKSLNSVATNVARSGGDIQLRAQALLGSITAVQRAATRLKSFTDINDYNSALSANQDLLAATGTFTSASSSITAITATRR